MINNKINIKQHCLTRGFTLIELILGISIFVLVASGVYQAFSVLSNTARLSRLKVAATLVANEEIEIARNLPYEKIGTLGGIPSGVLLQQKNVLKDGMNFNVRTTVRNIDDLFDGNLGGTPNDIFPADYKMVGVDVDCVSCGPFPTIKLTTTIAPKDIETTSDNGAIFINVFDAMGQPLSDADIRIINNNVNPTIDISDSSGVGGNLQIVDVPPSEQSYEISITRTGYSSDKTYSLGLLENPNPTKPHATVASRQATQISFSIDKTSSLNVLSATSNCTTTPNVGFELRGSKLLGTDPYVYKNNLYGTTDSGGSYVLSQLEWDTYYVSVPITSTSTHFLAGTLPSMPLSILPDSSQNLLLVTKPKSGRGLLVSVKDVSTGLPITGASVSLSGFGTKVTGRGSQAQVDWSGGGGQVQFINDEKYFYSEGLNTNNPSGEIKLSEILGEYEDNGYLESSTFDTGSSGNFYNIYWAPIDQPLLSGNGSVRFQLATNNDGTTWNFLGPDGTQNSYYMSSGDSINSIHNGQRYLRYRAYLSTENLISTPNISDIFFTYTSACVPSGQVFFDGLSFGDYELSSEKEGYVVIPGEPVSISSEWQEKVIYMTSL